jgi:DNA-directed RNA polymerase subunit beta'
LHLFRGVEYPRSRETEVAHLNPREAFEHLQTSVLEGIKAQFPVTGKLQTLTLDHLEVKDDLDHDDIRAQHRAKINGETWAVPVFASLTLKDNTSGKVIDSRKIRIAEIPKTTSRYSYIVGGQEYQIDSQWQLKPGVYVQRQRNGELRSHFNVPNKTSFKLILDPASKKFTMEYGRQTLPLYPIMKTMGLSDEELQRIWGKEIYDANKSAHKVSTAIEAFYRSTKKEAPPSKEVAAQHLYDTLTGSSLRSDATEVTLGKPFAHVTGEALRIATEKMLKVQAGHPEDDRDSLIFKDLRTVGDFAQDILKSSLGRIRAKTLRQVNTATNVRDVVKFDHFNEPLRQLFHKNAAARPATQYNPVEMVSSSMQTTVMGPGGIQSEKQINDETKFVNPSHFGFLDPINTPEGGKTGVTLRLPIGIKKKGKEPVLSLYNTKTGKFEDVGPATFLKSNVVLPDQVKWENNKPVPLGKLVSLAGSGNEIRQTKFEDAHYVMRYPSQIFNMTSNLIPFLGNTSGNRAGMAARHIEQAISLVHRDAPLVQVATGVPLTDSFEKLLGSHSSHEAPIAGEVTKIEKDAIHIKGADGKSREVQIYNNYPLNDAKSVMHSTPLVSVGDKVKAGQTIADTNFSKKGTLALGTNLRVAYIPFKGYNFEDGIVISESAAEKLSSEHLYKPQIKTDKDIVLSKKHFELQHPGIFTRSQLSKLDDAGVVRVGQRVSLGDPLVAATKPFQLKDRVGLSAIRKSMSGSHTNKSITWDADFEGEVVGVHRSGDQVTVHVKTIEPMQVGDKMAGRYGNKGIVTKILPDHEMPHTGDGKHIEVALNPSGIPGRMNVGQVLEVAAGKIAQKTGKTYLVKNFEPGVDQVSKVKKELEKHGLHDTEALFDPETKQALGHAMVGPQHMIKLVHQIDKKLSVRSGMSTPGMMGEHYDQNLQPGQGGGTGGQSMGTLGMYALLAHGAKANIREMQTWKSEGPDPTPNKDKQWPSQHNQVWAAIQTGAPLPTPKSTFAFQKFTDLLRGAGINVEKHGHNFILGPMTDSAIKQLAPNALPKASAVVQAKVDKNGDFKPMTGGLFDEKLTGGHQGRKWTRIELAEPLPNPVFENAIQRLTGLKKTDYYDIVTGQKAVTPAGHVTDVGAGLTGGHAIKHLLDKIDVKKDLEAAKKQLSATREGPKLDQALKKVKYLQALDQMNIKPSEAYILHNLPVVPPIMRPASALPTGDLKYADLNGLYKEFAAINEGMKKDTFQKHLTDSKRSDARKEYYDGVKALMGVGIPYADVKQKGILHTVAGANPKNGYFQETLMNRRQDLTMRSTIIPEPALGLDEVGLPKQAALDLFKPFVVKKLSDMGAVRSPAEAPALIDKKTPAVWHALDKVMAERPVLLKRDPALHKYSVQAFKPRIVAGSAVQIHPLVTGGYNADFDGDTMSVFVPITREAVQEAHKMFPSNNLFMEATGKVAYQPTLESALGLYKLSTVGKNTSQSFKHPGEAIEAVRMGKVAMNDVVKLGTHKTTAGRILLASVLPEPMQKDVLHDLKDTIDRKGLDKLLTTLARDHKDDFGHVVNKLKDMGNEATFGSVKLPHLPDGHSFKFEVIKNYGVAKTDPKKAIYVPMGTHSLGLEDFMTDKKVRDKVLDPARKQVESIYLDPKIPHADKERRAIQVWSEADKKMQELHEKDQEKNPSNLFKMYQAGVKPGWSQYKQMVLAPMLFQDSMNRTLPTPVTKSYSEGLDVAGYWNQMPGARRGAVMKVQEVREPGYMSKLLMNNMMHMIVNDHDCGTSKGVLMPVDDKHSDIHDRYLAQDYTHGKLHIPAGTLLSPDIVGQIAKNKNAQVVVRSPLKCEDHKGLCQKCVGVSATGHEHDLGTNIGVIAAHSVGERGIQLALKSFHTGGVVEQGGGGKLLNQFARFQQLMMLPEKVPNSATLAMKSGKVEKIEKDPTGVKIWVGGEMHHVGKDARGMHLHEELPGLKKDENHIPWKPPTVGAVVKAGQHLSDPNRTIVNPHHLYDATGNIEEVQNHLANEVHALYKGEGVKRRHVETVVKAMSNLSRVTDPGDHPHVLRGEFRPTSVINKLNKDLVAKGQKPIEHEPTLKGVDMLPHALQEDWIAKLQHNRLHQTLLEGASTGAASHLHGTHPVPGMAFGAEFGITKKDSLKPGYGHVANVPDHHY